MTQHQQFQQPPVVPVQPTTDGMPLRRPGTVTAAAILMFIFTGLAGLGAVALLILSLVDGPAHMLADSRLRTGLWLAVLAGAALLSALLVLGGSGTGRTIAFIVLGAGFVAGSTYFAINLANVPFIERSGSMTDFIMTTPLYILGLGLVAVMLLLLQGSKAARWFYQRSMASPVDPGTPQPRPTALTAALILLIVTGLVAGADAVRNLMRMPEWVYEYNTIEQVAARNVPLLTLPLVFMLVAIVGLAGGKSYGRALGLAVCGYYCYVGIDWTYGLIVTLLTPSIEFDGQYFISIGIGLTTALLAAATVVALSGARGARWIEQRRFGDEPPSAATPPGAMSPGGTGQAGPGAMPPPPPTPAGPNSAPPAQQ